MELTGRDYSIFSSSMKFLEWVFRDKTVEVAGWCDAGRLQVDAVLIKI
jgi:hypothetical protein